MPFEHRYFALLTRRHSTILTLQLVFLLLPFTFAPRLRVHLDTPRLLTRRLHRRAFTLRRIHFVAFHPSLPGPRLAHWRCAC